VATVTRRPVKGGIKIVLSEDEARNLRTVIGKNVSEPGRDTWDLLGALRAAGIRPTAV
jgi:hypothetical protein